MFTYNEIEASCKRAGVDPYARGTNIHATARSIYAEDGPPFDLSLIQFPQEELEQVNEIGIIVNNLVSQQKNTAVYTGIAEFKQKSNLEYLIKTATVSLEKWFEQGIAKTEHVAQEFDISYGYIYRIDSERVASVQKMDESMKIVHRDFCIKSRKSEEAIKKLFINT